MTATAVAARALAEQGKELKPFQGLKKENRYHSKHYNEVWAGGEYWYGGREPEISEVLKAIALTLPQLNEKEPSLILSSQYPLH